MGETNLTKLTEDTEYNGRDKIQLDHGTRDLLKVPRMGEG